MRAKGALFYSPVDFTDASDLHQSVQVWCIGEINRWIKQRTLIATRDTGSPCLRAVEASVWGVGLAGCRFLCAGKYLAPLIEHEWSGPQHLSSGRRDVSEILFMTWRAQGVMATCVQDVLSQGILCSSTTCGTSGCSEEALHVTASW